MHASSRRSSPASSRPTTGSSATAGTSATSARSSSGASTTGSCRARSCGRRRGARKPGFKAANVCWWYAMGATTDFTVTPRPIYHADGAKSPDCYTDPPELHDRLTGPLGEFPLFTYWGPTASIASSRWIARRRALLLDAEDARPADGLPAAPRLRPPALRARARRRRPRRRASSTRSPATWSSTRAGAATPSSCCRSTGSPTRAGRSTSTARCAGPGCSTSTRRRGWSTSTRGRRARSPWPTTRSRTSTCATPADVAAAREALAGLPGIDLVLEGDDAARRGPRPRARGRARRSSPSRDAWFTYYYWLDDERAPDFARTGRDPPQARLRPGRAVHGPGRPAGQGPRGRGAGAQEARLALRHGRRAARPVAGPRHARAAARGRGRRARCCSAPTPSVARDRIAATDVRDLLLELGGVGAPVAS